MSETGAVFSLTTEKITGLPLKKDSGGLPTTFVRCRIHATGQLLFSTPKLETCDPIFDHKELVSSKLRMIVFEVVDDNQSVIGGFKVDTGIIYNQLLKSPTQKMKIDYPLGAEKATLTLLFHTVTGTNASAPLSQTQATSSPLRHASFTAGNFSHLTSSSPRAQISQPAHPPPSTGAPLVHPPSPQFSSILTIDVTTLPMNKLQDLCRRLQHQNQTLTQELQQTQELLVQAQQQLAATQLPSVSPTTPLRSRKSIDSSIPTQTTPAPTTTSPSGSECVICNQPQQGVQRILIGKYIFCRKCASELRVTLGKSVGSMEAIAKYITEKGGKLGRDEASTSSISNSVDDSHMSDHPHDEESSNELSTSPLHQTNMSGSHSTPPGPNTTSSFSFRLDALINSAAPSPAVPNTNPNLPIGSPLHSGVPMSISSSVISPRAHTLSFVKLRESSPSTPTALQGTPNVPGPSHLSFSNTSGSSGSLNLPQMPSLPPLSQLVSNSGSSSSLMDLEVTGSNNNESGEDSSFDFEVPEDFSNILYNENDPTELKAATLPIIIKKLTLVPPAIDIDDFLLTYRSFCSSRELLDMIIRRYHSPGQDDPRTTKLRIFSILSKWVSSYWLDFTTDEICFQNVNQFLDQIVNNTMDNNDASVAKLVKQKLLKKKDAGDARLPARPAEGHAPIAEKDPFAPLIIGADPLEIARQITIRTWEVWASIHYWEFLGLAWTKPGKETKTANLIKMTFQFNQISGWVASSIITTARLPERIKIVKKFLDVIVHLRALGNFNGVMEIWSGFQRQPAFRMEKTFSEVLKDRKYAQIWQEIQELTSQEKNFANLRNMIQLINPPVIPYLGMYLSDLVFIEEGNPTKIGRLINVSKCRLVSSTIKRILQYQLKGPALHKVASIQNKLETLPILETEEEMYAISSFHEPKEGREPPARPAALDQFFAKYPPYVKPVVRNQILKGANLRKTSSCPEPAVPPPQRPTRPTGNLKIPIRFTDEEKEKAEQLCTAAWKGDVQEVQSLLSSSPVERLLNAPNARGQTALYCASHQGKSNVVLYLLGMDTIDVNCTCGENASTPLHAASYSGHDEVVAMLLFAGSDTNVKTKHGLLPVSEAKGADCLQIYELWDDYQSAPFIAPGSENAILFKFEEKYPILSKYKKFEQLVESAKYDSITAGFSR